MAGCLSYTTIPLRVEGCLHGDLVTANVLRDGHLLDLDKCGIYPAGYEFAHAVSKARAFDTLEAFEDLTEATIVRGCPLTRLSLLYFAAVFYLRPVAAPTPEGFRQALLVRLAELLDAADSAPADMACTTGPRPPAASRSHGGG